MSKRQRKSERKALLCETADAEMRARALATPRPIDEDFWYPGAGELLLRLSFQPSFEAPTVWEVRSHAGALAAYVSRGQEPESQLVVGHDLMPVDDSVLRAALDQLSLAALPLTPALTNGAVADDALYSATIQVGFLTSVRLSWCDGSAPDAWSPAIRALLALRRTLEQPGRLPSPSRASPLLVESCTSTVKLVRFTVGEFHVWDPGELGSLICGPDFILAIDVLADALRLACGEDIQVGPATIRRRKTGESWTSFREILPACELRGPSDLPRARQSTQRAWHYGGGHLFVGAELQEVLKALSLPDLHFSPGFSQFAGMRAY